MFAVPVPASPLPGALDFGLAVRRLLSDAVKASPYNASQIAVRMTDLIGAQITEHQLHAWTAPSREGWRFPLEYLPAFEAAAETHAITAWLADTRGGRLLVGRDALNAELGRLERMRDEAAKKIKQLKTVMGEAN
jgi:glutathione S-transferase